jgi:formiminoglutamase
MFCTFDLDAINVAYAPGVSAPNVSGLSAALWLDLAYAAGKSARVRSFDIVECNPNFDLDNRTVKLAALTVWNMVRGIADR